LIDDLMAELPSDTDQTHRGGLDEITQSQTPRDREGHPDTPAHLLPDLIPRDNRRRRGTA